MSANADSSEATPMSIEADKLFNGSADELVQLKSENQYLSAQAQKLAEANANAAEILAELEATRAELQERETYLRGLLEILPVGLFTVDPQTRKILSINSRALQISGHREEDVVGHICNTIVCPAQQHYRLSCPERRLPHT